MERACQLTRKALEESGGDPAAMDQTHRLHLARCRDCAREAEAYLRLHELLKAAVPPADPALAALVAAKVPAGPRRRLISLTPIAVGGLALAGGAMAVGGLPGVDLAAMVPGISLGVGITAAGGIGNLVTSGGIILQAVHHVVPQLVPLVAGGTAILGGLMMTLGVRRLGRSLV